MYKRQSEKGVAGAGARASNLTSVRFGSASVLSEPSSLPLSARPKPQEMLPMRFVRDMVDDGALSGALMAPVRAGGRWWVCENAVRLLPGPGAQGECGQPGGAADASPAQ